MEDYPWYADFIDGQGDENSDHGWFLFHEETGRVWPIPYATEWAARMAAYDLNAKEPAHA